MKRPYAHQPPESRWRSPAYTMRWFEDRTTTPYMDVEDSRQLVLSRFVRPLERKPQNVQVYLSGLCYASVLAYNLCGKGPKEYSENLQDAWKDAETYVRHYPLQVSAVDALFALRVEKVKPEDASDTLRRFLLERTWRYKPAQIVTLGNALMFGMCVIAHTVGASLQVLADTVVDSSVMLVGREIGFLTRSQP